MVGAAILVRGLFYWCSTPCGIKEFGATCSARIDQKVLLAA